MNEAIIKTRNLIISFCYKRFAKPIFFLIDPEKIHDIMIVAGKLLGSNPITRLLTRLSFSYSDKKLQQKIHNITFKNPIGLAAGFDKNAQLTEIIPQVGFGHMEVGSITGDPCKGNPKPRLWRLKKSQGLIVYYGLKNDGCQKIANVLKNSHTTTPLGVSIAKTNCKETSNEENGIKDYFKAYKTLKDLGDYITINISCPNAFGGQPFNNGKSLDKLLTKLETLPTTKPVFLKLPPDLKPHQLDELITTSDKHKIAGFICTNLTKDRNNKEISKELKDADVKAVGGISGKPIKNLSTKTIRHIYKKTQGRYTIIGCGGIFSAEDAYEKIKAGASLLQMITGMIFEGPQVISEINQGLARLLEKDGYSNISQAIGQEDQAPQ